MISCTEFIPFYSELFRYLHEKGGKETVMRYWEYISDEYVAPRLGEAVKENGMRGCWEYWSKSLNEEAADFTMTYDEENETFGIDMHHCPSKGRLNALTHMEPYDDYCGHCAVLYARVLKNYGITMTTDMTHVDEAKCICRAWKQKEEA